jgi:hypothetical protein
MIVNDLIQGVVDKLRGRDDLTSRIPDAIKKSVLDITQSTEFEELKVIGPFSNFIQNQSVYPLRGGDSSGVQGNPFIYDADVRLTFIKNWFIYTDTSGIITPGQSTGYNIKERDQRVVEPMSKILGTPSVCCIVGDKATNGVIMVGNMPNNPFATQMTYQRQHPFPSMSAPLSSLLQQHIYMPHEWQDIIEYAAAEKLCDVIGMTDVGTLYHQKLYGYKDKYGSDNPGLIQERRNLQNNMLQYNERALKPVVRRYT